MSIYIASCGSAEELGKAPGPEELRLVDDEEVGAAPSADGHGQGVLHDPGHADEGGLVLADAGRGQVNEKHLATVHDVLDVDRLVARAEDGSHGR